MDRQPAATAEPNAVAGSAPVPASPGATGGWALFLGLATVTALVDLATKRMLFDRLGMPGENPPIPLIPGIATISELMTGLARGYDHFKFFPAEPAGGVKMLQAFAGPFPGVTFCPTGGVGPDNYREYLALRNVACVGGSWVAPQTALDAGDWAQITTLAREAVEKSGR